MGEPSLQAEIDAANAYEELFVPALLGQWAPRVVDAAGIEPGQRVLDVACGTGVLAREAAVRTGPTGSVTGLDSSAGMLTVARRLEPEFEWRQARAESLPFPDGAFDAVVSQFGLMFFADRTQALREMLRVLAPGGRLAVAVWDSLDNTPAYASAVEILKRVAGERAADALGAPFMLGDRRDLARLFSDAGMASAEIRTHHGTGTVQFFYRSYLNTNPDEDVDINEFRYPGPKPFSKENAVLMMADSVEAASRTLKAYTRETISDLVENIVRRQEEEGQFTDADITFADITAIKEIFINRLANIYHSRIEYPE